MRLLRFKIVIMAYLFRNGVDIGKVADYSNEYYGRISLGGTVGVTLDNIKIE